MNAFIAYLIIIFAFSKFRQWIEKRQQKKEEQKKMWETLSNTYIPKQDDPVSPNTYKQIPRRKYRL
jgi:hypothetical protein